jgi:Cu-processing system ATP-binding protein
MSAGLEFSHVSKTFAAVRAVDDASFDVASGEVVGILGHNGAGKTTSMKLALGLIQPDEGRIRVMGEDPCGRNSNHLRRRLGYLPENVSFYQQLSGREVLRYFARLKHVEQASVERLLEQVGLSHAAERRIKTYSKGMRQRIGLAQALLGNPRLLLLDEPTAGLDPQATAEFYGLLDSLRAEGVSILISSHVLPGVEAHIDRAVIMAGGRVCALGSLQELRERARLPLVIRIQGTNLQAGMVPVDALDQLGYSVTEPNGHRLELHGPVQHKLDAMRLLVNMPGVDNLDVEQPSLEGLYAYFNRQSKQQESAR